MDKEDNKVFEFLENCREYTNDLEELELLEEAESHYESYVSYRDDNEPENANYEFEAYMETMDTLKNVREMDKREAQLA